LTTGRNSGTFPSPILVLVSTMVASLIEAGRQFSNKVGRSDDDDDDDENEMAEYTVFSLIMSFRE
jgi:hypothetical protein